ncbi:MAG: histidine kinase [Rhizobacter sp.]|nr:histidine kinase [Ferruginibacter sp.]
MLCKYRIVLMLVFFSVLQIKIFAQAPQLKFLHLNTEQGLPDGTVKSVTQDKYGYMWVGTQYGLSRYNGYDVTSFYHHKNDPGSLGGNFIWATFTDKAGFVWIVNDSYLSQYIYDSNSFINYSSPFNATITKIAEDEKGIFWLASSAGLIEFNPKTGNFTHYKTHKNAAVMNVCSNRINDFYLDKENGLLYLATNSGPKVYDYHQQIILPDIVSDEADIYHIKNNLITAVTKDKNGFVWFGCGFTNTVVVKWHPATKRIKYYTGFSNSNMGWKENRIFYLFSDQDGKVWVGGFTSALSLYLPEKDSFFHYRNDALLKSSIAGTCVTNIYQSRSGMIWIGLEGYGLDRFNPANKMFTSYQPSAVIQPSLLHDWGRAALQDRRGNLWFGTSKGISLYDSAKGTYTNYYNDEKNPSLLSFNSIRSLAEDKTGNIWIGTGSWLNRFDPLTKKIKIFNNADSLKSYFVWALLSTSRDELYVGGTGGLQIFDKKTQLFKDAADDTLINKNFKKNIRNIFEDSKQGLWMGVYKRGLLYYHPQRKVIKHYLHDEADANSLCNDFVTSVIEDQKGVIWIATHDGLSSLDTSTQKFRNFSTDDGLPSNKTAALRVDDANRIWIGTGNGLCMLDPGRKFFSIFNRSDGLSTNDFNDQQAASTRDGRFIYPTYRGFIAFYPENVQHTKPVVPLVYISGFKVLNKDFLLDKNMEEIKRIDLAYHQNFLSIELTGLNYENPEKIYYAYKLAPFNEEWIITQQRNINYTNLPGGTYRFVYKATTDPSDWNVPEHEITIYVSTVFYRTAWFVIPVIILLAFLLYLLYKYRLRQTRNVHRLQLQATRLEKDKTEIQYQNLINQFNPHFLFNSLTSLNSLIYENRELASDFLEQLSAVYRYLLTHKETQLVSVQAETDFVKHYISLLKTRFENGLKINISIPPELMQRKIVPVTLQLLIENALKHNMIDESAPLSITVFADAQYLYVTNNIQKKAFVENSNRKGLHSLQTLYKYLSSLALTTEQVGGKFIVRVPLL